MGSGVHSRESLVKSFPAVARAVLPRYDQIAQHEAPDAVWAFLVSNPFWNLSRTTDGDAYTRGQTVVAMAVTSAVSLELLTLHESVMRVGVSALVEHLPRANLVRNLEQALTTGRSEPFSVETLLGEDATETLARHLPPRTLWVRLIEPLAQQLGLIAPEDLAPTSNRKALDALLRSRTGMTMELDLADIFVDDGKPRTPTGMTMELRTSDMLLETKRRLSEPPPPPAAARAVPPKLPPRGPRSKRPPPLDRMDPVTLPPGRPSRAPLKRPPPLPRTKK